MYSPHNRERENVVQCQGCREWIDPASTEVFCGSMLCSKCIKEVNTAITVRELIIESENPIRYRRI